MIRLAKKEDAATIVKINTDSWFSTYSSFLPKNILKKRKLEENDRIKKWEKIIETDKSFFVIEEDSKIVGYVSFGKTHNLKYKGYGEIYSLYLMEQYHKKGLGKKLFQFALQSLKEKHSKIIVTCFTQNPAIEFYKKMNGKIVEETAAIIDGEEIKETILCYE